MSRAFTFLLGVATGVALIYFVDRMSAEQVEDFTKLEDSIESQLQRLEAQTEAQVQAQA